MFGVTVCKMMMMSRWCTTRPLLHRGNIPLAKHMFAPRHLGGGNVGMNRYEPEVKELLVDLERTLVGSKPA